MIKFDDLRHWTVSEVLAALKRDGVDVSPVYDSSPSPPATSLACSTNSDGSVIFKHTALDSLITRGDVKARRVEVELVFHPDGDLTLLARSVTDLSSLSTRNTVLSTRYDDLTWWELTRVCRAAVRLWESGP